MFATVIENYLKEKKIYTLVDQGWYYDRVIRCFEDEAEAKAFWEKVTGVPFMNYQEYIKTADRPDGGHWYYSLEVTTLWDLFQEKLSEQKEQVIREEAKQIQALGDKMIQTKVRKEVEKEFSQAIDGALYYLFKTSSYSPSMWNDERKKAFEEGLSKF